VDEAKLVAALLNSREAYEQLAGRLDPDDFSDQGAAVLRAGVAQYKRDPAAVSVDRDVLASAVKRMFANEKHAESILGWLDNLPASVSDRNVVAEYRLLRRERVGFELAAKMGAGEHDDPAIPGLIEKYQELGREGTTEKDRPDLDDLLAANADGVRMRLYPAGVNRACRGGALPGHNITVFARPEAGKTLLAINIAAGFLRDGRRVLYTGNEEPIDDLVRRTLARLSGVPLSRIYESNDALRQAYRKAGDLYDRFYPKQTVSGRLSEVEALVRKYKPDVVIIDQLRNLTSGGESNKTLDLDKIAQGIRDLAKREQIVTVGLTQAGDSADQKLKLGMGDIEWSNTGIPAAADLMIGMGVNDKWDANNRRMINLPKNKIGGQHVSFPVFIDSEKQLIRTRRSTND
jgi:KaiC/GvpD/RAD55 family RecA-like ATPase